MTDVLTPAEAKSDASIYTLGGDFVRGMMGGEMFSYYKIGKIAKTQSISRGPLFLWSRKFAFWLSYLSCNGLRKV